ncbi:MAG: hypothetical protein WA231_04135 [Methylocella sp.]
MAENVWTNAGMNVFGKDRDALLTMHPTVKPLPLLVDMIMVTPRRRPPLSPRPVVIYENDRGQSWCVCGQARYGREPQLRAPSPPFARRVRDDGRLVVMMRGSVVVSGRLMVMLTRRMLRCLCHLRSSSLRVNVRA